MATVTAVQIGDIYAKHGVLNNAAVYAEVAALQMEVPVTDVLDRPQEERQRLYREAHQLMYQGCKEVDQTDDGWTFTLSEPIVGGNGATIEQLALKRPSGRVIAHYGAPAKYRSGPPLLRWQLATCADLPVNIIEALGVGDYLHIAEVVGIHANADFELINS